MDFDRAKALNSQILSSNNRWARGRYFDSRPNMLGELVSMLAYALGDYEVDYVSASVPPEDDVNLPLLVHVFSGDLLIEGVYDDGAAMVLVRPLDVQRVEILSSKNYLSGSFDDSHVTAAVEIGGRTYGLPSKDATGANRNDLEAFLPKLVERLRNEA